MKKLAAVVTALVLGAPLVAQQPRPEAQPKPGDGLEQALFAPELIMRHYREIALEPEQRQVITGAIQELQSGMVDLQWQLMDAAQKVQDVLDRPRIEESVALGLLGDLFTREQAVKRANLTALIRIKNALTPEQQERLRALRARDARIGAGPGPGPGSTPRPEGAS